MKGDLQVDLVVKRSRRRLGQDHRFRFANIRFCQRGKRYRPTSSLFGRQIETRNQAGDPQAFPASELLFGCICAYPEELISKARREYAGWEVTERGVILYG